MIDLRSLFQPKSGGDLYTQDLSPPEAPSKTVGGNGDNDGGPPAWLYYFFLVVVLIFLIDQGCRDEPSAFISKFNPMKWEV
jgi:hypothetical protein